MIWSDRSDDSFYFPDNHGDDGHVRAIGARTRRGSTGYLMGASAVLAR